MTSHIEWPTAPGKLVIVNWLDPTGGDIGWEKLEAIAASKPTPCQTVGWIVYEDDDRIVIVSSVCTDSAAHLGTSMALPVGCIESIDVVTFG